MLNVGEHRGGDDQSNQPSVDANPKVAPGIVVLNVLRQEARRAYIPVYHLQSFSHFTQRLEGVVRLACAQLSSKGQLYREDDERQR